MDSQNWKSLRQSSPGSSPKENYNVQSTYIPPQPSYDDPFAPADSNPFAGSNTGAPVQAAEVPSSPNSQPLTGPSTLLQFHESDMANRDVRGKLGGASTPEVPPVQAYSAAQRLLGGFLSSSGVDSDPNSDKPPGIFSLKRYRTYFNVDTSDVLLRMLDSVIGCFKPNFLEKTAESADLYGPFWVATTLVFVSAVTGNYASYISHKHDKTSQTTTDSWYYDIDKVGYSAILFYGYVGLIGFILFATLRWGFKAETTLVQTWCAYGYSLSIFIPMSFFCIFPLEILRWSLVGAATLTSGLFLLLNFRKPIFASAGARALPVWLVMAGLHTALGLALKLYFFRYKSTK